MTDCDPSKFINSNQIGGIERYTIDDGQGRGVRVMWINTGGGLRYRVLVDRGMDIDQTFFGAHSLAFLTHKGVAAPSRGLDRGADWLKGFPGGLLASCGPFNVGRPVTDEGEELGLHGPHSNTAAEVRAIVRPDVHREEREISVTGCVRYGRLFGPCLELRRTIRSRLGENSIGINDEFYNAGNTAVPHAWLLHINFGYPLLDEGAQFCYDARVEARDDERSKAFFAEGKEYRRVPAVLPDHTGRGEAVAYLFPKADDQGRAVVGVVNPKLELGVAVHYSSKQFPRCGNWQHWGRYEYVGALEPMNGTVEGRDKDRARGLMDEMKPGQTRTYNYSFEVLSGRSALTPLLSLGATASSPAGR